MKNLLTLLLCFVLAFAHAQNKDEKAIRSILANQITYWNKGDIPHFMDGYWKNDSLVFVGKNGPTYGFYNTLHNYQKNYPDTSSMGQLAFKIITMKPLYKDHYFVIGQWTLIRSIGNLSGHYTLLLKKIKGKWKIIADHSS